MCFGGSSGESADELYKEMRQEPEPLPSLSVSKKKRSDVKLGDVPKPIGGVMRSSLLTALKSSY